MTSPALNTGGERFLSSYKTFDLTPDITIGFVLLVRNAEGFSHAFILERLDPSFFFLNKEYSNLKSVEEDGYDQRIEELILVALLYDLKSVHFYCGCGGPCAYFCVVGAIF